MLETDEYGTVLLYKAWNADVSTFSNICKSGMIVTKNNKLLQTAGLLSDVNEFIFRIILI